MNCPNEQLSFNEGANNWRYEVGVPTIPGELKSKKPAVNWQGYQLNPPSEQEHKQWLSQGKYNGGVMILCGSTLYRKDGKKLYLVGLDIDRRKGIDTFCTRDGKTISLHDLSEQTLVEQHEDCPDRCHVFYLSPIEFPVKRPDSILGIEVKSSWNHGLMRVTPSITESGFPMTIIGNARRPAILNESQATELLQHINQICVDNGIEYLDGEGYTNSNRSYLTPELRRIIKSLNLSFDSKNKVNISNGRRNNTLIAVADSILFNHLRKDRSNEYEIKEFFKAINAMFCYPSLPESEVEDIWNRAVKWAYPKIINDTFPGGKEKGELEKFEDLKTKLESEYHFKTLKDTDEIWYYDETKGTYIITGEVLIKAKLEQEFGSRLTNHAVGEFLGHIKRSSYFDRSAFNPRIEWIACKNCMLNLRTGQTALFSPHFLNTTSIPVIYSEVYATGYAADFFRLVERRVGNYGNSQCPKIMKFLHDIVQPEDVELLLDFIAYCLWRDYKFAIWLLIVGYGQNGKSVLLNLIEIFLGEDNTSSESLDRLLTERFAPALLYQKLANIDADVSGDILIKDTGKIKKLTGNDEYPGEFKYKTPFKFRNYAKLVFSCNEIPKTDDTTDAFFRRLIIINLMQQFLAGQDDPHILDKVATEEELSGLLHEVLDRLPRILRQGIRATTNDSMRETYEKYVKGSDPVKYFSKKALVTIDASGSTIPKDEMYNSYLFFCRENNITPESEQSFSRKLTDLGYRNRRIQRDKKREYCWIDVKILNWEASEDTAQQTLTVPIEEERGSEGGMRWQQ